MLAREVSALSRRIGLAQEVGLVDEGGGSWWEGTQDPGCRLQGVEGTQDPGIHRGRVVRDYPRGAPGATPERRQGLPQGG